ncbi:MAG: TorF family putative porin [Bacteroidota bacterium]|nr:TorF family putative porin [Bacteroidota bacterium]
MMKSILSVLFIIVILSINSHSQQSEKNIHLNSGVDLVSSYNWRAIDFGNSPAIQPYISLSAFNFELSGWGSYALIAQEEHDGKSVPFSEIDLSAKYSIPTSIGTFSPGVVDFFYPYEHMRYSDYKGVDSGESKGAHWVNVGLTYTGSESFPISLTIDYAIHNDPDKPIYFEVGYPVKIEETNLNLFVGAAKGSNKASLYGIEDSKFGIVNAGVTLSKSLTITKDFSIPLSTSFVMNPYLSKAFIVFKASF